MLDRIIKYFSLENDSFIDLDLMHNKVNPTYQELIVRVFRSCLKEMIDSFE